MQEWLSVGGCDSFPTLSVGKCESMWCTLCALSTAQFLRSHVFGATALQTRRDSTITCKRLGILRKPFVSCEEFCDNSGRFCSSGKTFVAWRASTPKENGSKAESEADKTWLFFQRSKTCILNFLRSEIYFVNHRVPAHHVVVLGHGDGRSALISKVCRTELTVGMQKTSRCGLSSIHICSALTPHHQTVCPHEGTCSLRLKCSLWQHLALSLSLSLSAPPLCPLISGTLTIVMQQLIRLCVLQVICDSPLLEVSWTYPSQMMSQTPED